MNVRDLFIDAIRNADELPALVRDCASSASGVESNSFDRSYLEFLDHQIELNTRGEQWTQRHSNRADAYAHACDTMRHAFLPRAAKCDRHLKERRTT